MAGESKRRRGSFFLFRPVVLLLLVFSTPALFSANQAGGISYIHEELPEGPWSTHVLKISRTNANYSFTTTLGNGSSYGMSIVSDQVRTVSPALGEPIAAVNGDFYNSEGLYFGAPRGLQVRNGELVSGPAAYSCFWIDAKGEPHIDMVQSRFQVRWPNGKTTPFELNTHRYSDGVVLYTPAVGSETLSSSGLELILERADNQDWLPLQPGKTMKVRVRETRNTGNSPVGTNTLVLSVGPRLARTLGNIEPGSFIELTTSTAPDLRGVKVAIGGGPTLVRNGKATSFSGRQRRHPRTALGWNDEFFYLVEVDGRQLESVGMTFPELARYMVRLGCTEAMNLDGGGSSTFWLFGNVLNHPSEGRERPSPNALVVLQKKQPQPAARRGDEDP